MLSLGGDQVGGPALGVHAQVRVLVALVQLEQRAVGEPVGGAVVVRRDVVVGTRHQLPHLGAPRLHPREAHADRGGPGPVVVDELRGRAQLVVRAPGRLLAVSPRRKQALELVQQVVAGEGGGGGGRVAGGGGGGRAGPVGAGRVVRREDQHPAHPGQRDPGHPAHHGRPAPQQGPPPPGPPRGDEGRPIGLEAVTGVAQGGAQPVLEGVLTFVFEHGEPPFPHVSRNEPLRAASETVRAGAA